MGSTDVPSIKNIIITFMVWKFKTNIIIFPMAVYS